MLFRSRAAEYHGVIDGFFHARLKFVDAIRQAGQAAFAAGPIARGHVVQHLRELVFCQQPCELFFWKIVRKQIFNTLESRFGGRGKAVEEWHFVEHQGQVGAESGHGGVEK